MGNDRAAIQPQTPQIQVAELAQRANQGAQAANLLFIVGSVVAAAGLSLIAWDLFRDGAVNVAF
jgi:hypothetical protein